LFYSDVTYVATGKSCSYASGIGKLPDYTLTRGRPVIGRIIFNVAKFSNSINFSNQMFNSLATTAIHEMIHIIGFDKALYSYFLEK
jgi:hypothetical protein